MLKVIKKGLLIIEQPLKKLGVNPFSAPDGTNLEPIYRRFETVSHIDHLLKIS
jgi:hypothetical protein